MTRHVRIIGDSRIGFATITDAETGEPIHGVGHVSIDIPPGGPFVATLDVLSEVDIIAEAVISEIDVRAHDKVPDADSR